MKVGHKTKRQNSFLSEIHCKLNVQMAHFHSRFLSLNAIVCTAHILLFGKLNIMRISLLWRWNTTIHHTWNELKWIIQMCQTTDIPFFGALHWNFAAKNTHFHWIYWKSWWFHFELFVHVEKGSNQKHSPLNEAVFFSWKLNSLSGNSSQWTS